MLIPIYRSVAVQTDLQTSLKTAVSELQRLSLLKDTDFVFDFVNSTTGISKGDGGHTVQASSINYPAVIGHGTLVFPSPSLSYLKQASL